MLAHMMLARLDPAFAITEQEAHRLATAYAGWRQYYGPSLIDPRTQALLVLAGVVWEVERPKVTTYLRNKRQRQRAQAAAKAAPQGASNPAAPVDPAVYGMPPSAPTSGPTSGPTGGNVVQMPGL